MQRPAADQALGDHENPAFRGVFFMAKWAEHDRGNTNAFSSSCRARRCWDRPTSASIPLVLKRIASEVLEIQQSGVQVACVIGGGNIFRGAGLARAGIDRVTGDHMGMLATVMNALAMQDAIESLGGTRACRARSASTRYARTTFAAARCATWKRAASSSSRPARAIPTSRPTAPRPCAPSRSKPTCC